MDLELWYALFVLAVLALIVVGFLYGTYYAIKHHEHRDFLSEDSVALVNSTEESTEE